MRHPRGFTLIELLIVVVIIGILAAIAIPKYAVTKAKARDANLRSDLRNMATAQESYFYDHGVYSDNAAALAPAFTPTSGVVLTITAGTTAGWAATATTDGTFSKCALFYGAVAAPAPAVSEGSIVCQ